MAKKEKNVTSISSNRKAIWFQGPSKDIVDPKAFKRSLTKKYAEARSTWGDVKVLYRGYDTSSQADQLIGEWAKQGFKKFFPPKKLHKDPKTNKLYNKKYGDQLFLVNKKGMPVIDKEPINISKINIPKNAPKDFVDRQLNRWTENKQLVNRFSFNTKGDVVYPGKDTKKHFQRFEQLTARPLRKGELPEVDQKVGLGIKKGFEAYLDELEDIGRGSTKQAPDTFQKLSVKGAEVTKLPLIGQGQGQVTKVKADINSMLAGLQVAEEKASYYSLGDATIKRIADLKKDVSFPLKSGEYLSEDVDNPDKKYIVTEDDPNYGTTQPKVKKSALTDSKFRSVLKSQVDASNQLEPDVQDGADSDKVLQLTKVDNVNISGEDKAIRKENFKLDKLSKIKNVAGSKMWDKWVKSPASKRVLLNILGDVFKTSSTLGVTSSDVNTKEKQITKVIDSPHKKGILIRANPALLKSSAKEIREKEGHRLKLEKKYIGNSVTRSPDDYSRNVNKKEVAVQVRKEITDDQRQAKRNRVGGKIAKLRSSGDRSLAGIKSYIAQNTPPDKTLAKSGGVVGNRWYPGKGIKIPEKTFPKQPHTKGLKVDAPIDARPKIKIKKVTGSMTKYYKPISKEAGVKGIEDKLKVTADKKALPVNKELTTKVTKELQKKFHGKDKPRYKSTVGKGLKFTRGLGAFSLFSSIFGVVRARKDAKQTLQKHGIKRNPSVIETLQHTLPKYARPKYFKKIPDA